MEKLFTFDKNAILNATMVAVFLEGEAMPIIYGTGFHGEEYVPVDELELTVKFNLRDGCSVGWACSLTHTGGYFKSVCARYGCLIDPTKEEFTDMVSRRLIDLDFQGGKLVDVPNKLLSFHMKMRKGAYLRLCAENKIKESERVISREKENVKKQLEEIAKYLD